MGAAVTATFESIRDLHAGASYPGALLRGREDALVLFAAAWLGRQDAFWVAEAGLVGTCVDRDGELLAEMEWVYPSGWRFVEGDCYEFAEKTDEQWDVVSLDCPSDQFQLCADNLQLWCDISRFAVILGTGVGTKVEEPDGWRITDTRKRSDFLGGVWWTCLEPA